MSNSQFFRIFERTWMRYHRPEPRGEFVVGSEVGLSKGVLDMGPLRRRLELEVRAYEGSCWGKGQIQ